MQIARREFLTGAAAAGVAGILPLTPPGAAQAQAYGLQKYVEWTPNPNQRFEIRKFNLKLRRA